jgi:hypothetical protein
MRIACLLVLFCITGGFADWVELRMLGASIKMPAGTYLTMSRTTSSVNSRYQVVTNVMNISVAYIATENVANITLDVLRNVSNHSTVVVCKMSETGWIPLHSVYVPETRLVSTQVTLVHNTMSFIVAGLEMPQATGGPSIPLLQYMLFLVGVLVVIAVFCCAQWRGKSPQYY